RDDGKSGAKNDRGRSASGSGPRPSRATDTATGETSEVRVRPAVRTTSDKGEDGKNEDAREQERNRALGEANRKASQTGVASEENQRRRAQRVQDQPERSAGKDQRDKTARKAVSGAGLP